MIFLTTKFTKDIKQAINSSLLADFSRPFLIMNQCETQGSL